MPAMILNAYWALDTQGLLARKSGGGAAHRSAKGQHDQIVAA